MSRPRRFKIGTTFLIVAVVIFYIRNRDALRTMLAPRQPSSSTPVSSPGPAPSPPPADVK
jgi:hypothetical protein